MGKELTKYQISLLLYLETCAVDHAGRVDGRKMNTDGFAQAKLWNKSRFIRFGRISTRDAGPPAADGLARFGGHWVTLSDEAWETAHHQRQVRAARLWGNRNFMTTEEWQRGTNHPTP